MTVWHVITGLLLLLVFHWVAEAITCLLCSWSGHFELLVLVSTAEAQQEVASLQPTLLQTYCMVLNSDAGAQVCAVRDVPHERCSCQSLSLAHACKQCACRWVAAACAVSVTGDKADYLCDLSRFICFPDGAAARGGLPAAEAAAALRVPATFLP